MSGLTEYIFYFELNGEVIRIPYAKWNRIREGKECIEEFANRKVYIAYAYILLENRKPDYCPRIDGAIYYFDTSGRVIEQSHYFDLLQDADEEASGVISLQHRRKNKDVAKKYRWQLNSQQRQTLLNCIW